MYRSWPESPGEIVSSKKPARIDDFYPGSLRRASVSPRGNKIEKIYFNAGGQISGQSYRFCVLEPSLLLQVTCRQQKVDCSPDAMASTRENRLKYYVR